MSSVDLFLHDVLDVDPKTLHGISEIVSGSSIRFDVLLGYSALTANLAFHEAWKVATFGSHPSRLDYEAFVKNLPGANPSSGVAWSESTMNAFIAALSTGTHVVINPHHSKLIQSAGETYQRVLASLAHSGGAGAKRLLLAKLADRFCGDSNQHDTTPLINSYAAMVLSDPRLEDLEDWASTTTPYIPPKSIQEYYDRTAIAGKKLNLPFCNPITNLRLDLGSDSIPSLSCIELLRIPLSRDGFMWRRDSGGALVVLGKQVNKTIEQIVSSSAFKFRVARGVPSTFLYKALPLLVYSRVLIHDKRFECVECAPRGPGEIVILSDIDSPVSEPRRIVVSSNPPENRTTYWIPEHTDIHTATSILTVHLQNPCPLRAAQNAVGGGSGVLFHKFMAQYVHKRSLGTRVFQTPNVGSLGEVVLVDNRSNIWSVWSILVTLDNLRAENWAVSVFCSDANLKFLRSNLLPRVPNARIEVLDDLNVSPFDIETYNSILKSPAFWDKIRSPRALVVQDDGVLIRPGLDDDREILSQDFVGAPWIDVPDNRKMLERAGVGAGLVGNGGFSLRSVKAMREIAQSDGDSEHGRATFCGNIQPVPEDVFFASAVNRRGRSCPREVSERFAFEEKLPTNQNPLGFHKPWPYNKASELTKYFDDVLGSLEAKL